MRSSAHTELVGLLPELRRYAYALSRSMADADDLLQATVERLLSRPRPEDVDLKRWAFRICRNMWIDEVRARQVRQKAANDPDLAGDAVIAGEQQMMSILTMREATAAMRRLPDDQREALALVAIGGLSYKDAAAELNIPLGTVMSRIARARGALAKQLQGGASETGEEHN